MTDDTERTEPNETSTQIARLQQENNDLRNSVRLSRLSEARGTDRYSITTDRGLASEAVMSTDLVFSKTIELIACSSNTAQIAYPQARCGDVRRVVSRIGASSWNRGAGRKLPHGCNG